MKLLLTYRSLAATTYDHKGVTMKTNTDLEISLSKKGVSSPSSNRDGYKCLQRLLALLVVIVITLPVELVGADDVTKPPDGSGIKWSTVALITTEQALANGDSVRGGVPWNPYIQTFVNSYFYQYNVELQDKTKISGIFVLLNKPPDGTPQAEKDKWEDIKYWCYGLAFGGSKLYSPEGGQVEAILKAGWKELNACAAKPPKGDIIVYRATGDQPPYVRNNDPVHAALANGDGTYSSKDRYLPVVPNQTKQAMDKQYNGKDGNLKAEAKCYSPVPQGKNGPDEAKMVPVSTYNWTDSGKAQFYPLQLNPQIGFGDFLPFGSTGEMMYVVPQSILTANDITSVDVVAEEDNPNLYRVEVMLSSSALANLSDMIAIGTPEAVVVLVWNAQVAYLYSARSLYDAAQNGTPFIVAGDLDPDVALELRDALAP